MSQDLILGHISQSMIEKIAENTVIDEMDFSVDDSQIVAPKDEQGVNQNSVSDDLIELENDTIFRNAF